ncbi:hypothetical protein CUMW_231550 [Citrus unshiu]|uniref:Cupin type-1 domain-containing protein n=1 Tax=Citrus unshiu TaxID=55188 RepID=A0A2H5QHS6_CITUN|nr:hypothetical protein CUMW_231550 [Citrus unshiu]
MTWVLMKQSNMLSNSGLNTLGVISIRIDYAPNGQSPPHIHPRASEILLVLEGTLYAWFCDIRQP